MNVFKNYLAGSAGAAGGVSVGAASGAGVASGAGAASVVGAGASVFFSGHPANTNGIATTRA
jgi:hypothetical protein